MSAALTRAVYNEYGPALHRYLMRRLSNSQTARDLAQDVYVRLLRVPHADLIRSPQAYVFRIASNLVYELQQRERRDPVMFNSRTVDYSAERVSDPAVREPGEQVNMERQLESVLAQLPPRYAAILVLRKRDGLSLAEIARQLNLSVHTCRKYLMRAVALARAARWDC